MALVVNGEAVGDEELRDEARALRPRYYEMIQEGSDGIAMEIQLREWCRENVIERVLMRQEAQRRAITPEALVHAIASRVSPPKYKDVGEFYRRHKASLWVPEVVRVAHIVKNVDENVTEEKALEAIRRAEEELKAGGDFKEVASRLSDCPSDGIDLGWLPRGQMVEQFDDVVFRLNVGETSEIFRTTFGFHLAKVLGRKPAGVPGLMDVRQSIEDTLRKEKQQKALEQFVDALKAHARIEG